MKCAKCGAELKLGCIYCSVCGQEAQIVSEDSLLEEELLNDLLKEDKPIQAKQKKTVLKKKKRTHKPLIISLCCMITAIIAGVVVLVTIQKQNENSYDYQVKKAEDSYAEKNYVKALDYYNKALSLKEDDLDVRHRMVEVYMLMEEEKSAISLLHEILLLNALDEKAYQLLIDIYEQNHNYEAILKLKEGVKDDRLLELFSAYEAAPPVFSMDSGTYADYITIELSTEAGSDIYYTLDGSSPIENGTKYEVPFEINQQNTLIIQAVSCNEYGIYSSIATGTFTVKFEKPKMATAIPDSGTFLEPTKVELVGSEGSRMYYTWDGSDPTLESAQYAEPLDIPEGDNILSVLLVDKYGMMSDVLKCNYKYLP